MLEEFTHGPMAVVVYKTGLRQFVKISDSGSAHEPWFPALMQGIKNANPGRGPDDFTAMVVFYGHEIQRYTRAEVAELVFGQ